MSGHIACIAQMWPVAADHWVCASAPVEVTLMYCAKTTEPVQMPLGGGV